MTDSRVVTLVVYFLGALAALGLGGVIFLVGTNHTTEEVSIVVALAGPPIGALGTLLASTRSGPAEVQPVVVANEDTDPVPVEAAVAVEADKPKGRR
jgi:hypothetical protein